MADPREIHYAGGQTIDNSELTTQKVETAKAEVMQELSNEVIRATGRENEIDARVDGVAQDIATEIENRQHADDQLATKIGDLANLETVNKNNLVGAVNEVLSKIPAESTIDTEMSDTSENAVQNKTIKKYVDYADENLQTQINTINETLDNVLPLDDEPTESSEKGAKSGGIFDAIRFASVKIGETMFWHEADVEERIVRSDEEFNFLFKGHVVSVTPIDGKVTLIISKNEPEGWWPLNGKAELKCSDYPELAKFFGGTQNADGSWNADGNNVAEDWVDGKSFNAKIWLPYVQQKIIKAKY